MLMKQSCYKQSTRYVPDTISMKAGQIDTCHMNLVANVPYWSSADPLHLSIALFPPDAVQKNPIFKQCISQGQPTCQWSSRWAVNEPSPRTFPRIICFVEP